MTALLEMDQHHWIMEMFNFLMIKKSVFMRIIGKILEENYIYMGIHKNLALNGIWTSRLQTMMLDVQMDWDVLIHMGGQKAIITPICIKENLAKKTVKIICIVLISISLK